MPDEDLLPMPEPDDAAPEADGDRQGDRVVEVLESIEERMAELQAMLGELIEGGDE